jgi:hypothetical protein
MAKRKAKKPPIPSRLTSLHPLTPEQALRGFMQVDPKKVEKAKKDAKAKKPS